jgi:hypothetical protein
MRWLIVDTAWLRRSPTYERWESVFVIAVLLVAIASALGVSGAIEYAVGDDTWLHELLGFFVGWAVAAGVWVVVMLLGIAVARIIAGIVDDVRGLR